MNPPLTINKSTGLLTSGATLHLIPGGKPMPVRRCAVIHYTEGGTAASSIDWWEKPANRRIDLGAHFIIDRDGTIYQCRSINQTISHAGVSRWKDPETGRLYKNLNSCSIGIELANAGSEVERIKVSGLKGYAGTTKMRHRNESKQKTWEVFPQAQWEACYDLCSVLRATYDLDDITGHDCIAPERKTDPGPAFDGRMRWIRQNCGFEFELPIVHQP